MSRRKLDLEQGPSPSAEVVGATPIKILEAEPLPPYLIVKRAANGTARYHWSPRVADIRAGFHIRGQALGADVERAVRIVTEEFLPELYRWRAGETHTGNARHDQDVGTVGWLITKYLESSEFRNMVPTSKINGTALAKKICRIEFKKKPGFFFGETPLTDLDEHFAYAFFERFRESTDPTKVSCFYLGTRESRLHPYPAGTNSARAACRLLKRAHHVVRRSHPKIVPALNPWVGMGIKYKERLSPAATRTDFALAIEAADDLGMSSLGTLIFAAWELMVRPRHLCLMKIGDYRPKSHPNEILIPDRKQGIEVWRTLFDNDRKPLYPDLMARLERVVKGRQPDEPLFRREYGNGQYSDRGWLSPCESLAALYGAFAKIRKHANLESHVTLRGFRTGGLTEAGSSSLTEAEIMAQSLHSSSKTLARYLRASDDKIINGRSKIDERRRKLPAIFSPLTTFDFVEHETVSPHMRRHDFKELSWNIPTRSKPFWLTDKQFSKVSGFFPIKPKHNKRSDVRQLLSGIINRMMNGRYSWSKSPEIYGAGNNLYKYYVRWMADGTLEKVVSALTPRPKSFEGAPEGETGDRPELMLTT